VNVVASGDINEGINLDRMSADSCGSAIYHPHLFSAIKQGHTADPTPIANDKQCTNTFQTGKFNTMALKSEADAIRAAEQVILSLVKYVRPDVHPNPNTRYQDRLQRFTQPCVSIGTEAITLDNGDKITVDQFVHSISDII
jgi:TATA-box binding protein (TBP) (component of TFIID and TFIIIB)